ncbi:hypothetical protein ACLMJK_001091 [Lecanora helva]
MLFKAQFFFLSAHWIVLLPSAFAAFKYVDSSCNDYGGITSGVQEAITALGMTYNALVQPQLEPRVQRTLISLFGAPSSPGQGQEWLAKLKSIYQTKYSLLGPSQSNAYVYCGDSIVWSTRMPDPDDEDCLDEFDPSEDNGAHCGVDVQERDNIAKDGKSILGFWYAPNPHPDDEELPEGFDSPGEWVQLYGIDNPRRVPPGEPYCSVDGVEAVTIESGNSDWPSFILLCEDSFRPPADRPNWVNTNTNSEYWKQPRDLGALLDAHQGSLSFHIMHEIGHAFEVSDDQRLPDGQLAHSWDECAALAEVNHGRPVKENKAIENCDSQAFFAIEQEIQQHLAREVDSTNEIWAFSYQQVADS